MVPQGDDIRFGNDDVVKNVFAVVEKTSNIQREVGHSGVGEICQVK